MFLELLQCRNTMVSCLSSLPEGIKTHDSVPKKPVHHTVGILTGRKKMSFSHLCISVIPYPIGTKFPTELPTCRRSLHTKLEGNHYCHFRDTSCQSLDFFSSFFSSSCFHTLAKIAIKYKCILQSP